MKIKYGFLAFLSFWFTLNSVYACPKEWLDVGKAASFAAQMLVDGIVGRLYVKHRKDDRVASIRNEKLIPTIYVRNNADRRALMKEYRYGFEGMVIDMKLDKDATEQLVPTIEERCSFEFRRALAKGKLKADTPVTVFLADLENWLDLVKKSSNSSSFRLLGREFKGNPKTSIGYVALNILHPDLFFDLLEEFDVDHVELGDLRDPQS